MTHTYAFRLLAGLFALGAPFGHARADTVIDPAYLALPPAADRVALSNHVAQAHTTWSEKAKTNPDLLVRPGMIADRKAQQVTLYGSGSGVAPLGVIEFLLVSHGSGHEYESAGVGFTKASDLKAGLQHIGVEPGQPVSPDALRFWPRGGRTVATVHYLQKHLSSGERAEPNEPPRALRLEQFAYDQRVENLLPETPFCLSGSVQAPHPEPPAQTILAADAYGPMSLVSLFNTSDTLIEFPWQAGQKDVYEAFRLNPASTLSTNQPMLVTFRPFVREDGLPVERDLEVQANATGVVVKETTEGIPADKRLDYTGDLALFIAACEPPRAAGHDLYLSWKWDADMTLNTVQKLSSVLVQIDQQSGIRLLPPASDQPYYRAFLPPEPFRDPTKRPSQPREIHINDEGHRLELVKEDWSGDEPTYTRKTWPVAGPETLLATMKEHAPTTRTTFVYAPADTPLKKLTPWLAPLLTEQRILFIFSETP